MKILQIFLIVVAWIGLQASSISEEKVILKIGNQMSNMRYMLETYSLIGAGVSYKAPLARLKKSMQEYEETIEMIEKNHQDPEIHKSISIGKKAWKPVKASFLTAFTKSDQERMQKEALFIHANIRSVIRELEHMKKYLIHTKNIRHKEELNAAIEIAASSKRLSAHYMMKMWRLPDPTIQKHWEKGVKIYTQSIEVLQNSSFASNPEFKKELENTKKILDYLRIAFDFKGKYIPALVHEKAQRAYKSANKMISMILMK